MRSHAKASSAGSTQGRGSRSGSFARGADATRGFPANADGSGAPSQRRSRIAISLFVALFVLAILSASALASKDVTSYIGSASGSGSKGGEFNSPRDSAVNGSGAGPANAGDLYVADEANNRIERFSSTGAFISAWGANATHRDEIQRLVINATSGTFTLSFEGDSTEPIAYGANESTVDNALDVLSSIGADANVNVTLTGFGGPRTYTVTFTGALSGTNVGQMTVNTSSLEGTAELSTTENGSGGAGSDYEICTLASKCGQALASGGNTTAAGNGSLSAPQSVAVDPDTGNVYVSDRDNRRIDEYDGEGNFIRSFGFDVAESGPGDTGTGYEVCNQAEGDVCKAGEGGSGVGQYGSGSPENGFGIAVSPSDGNASTGSVYLADSGNQRVDTYNLDGTSPASFGSSANFGSEQPRSIAVDSRGIVYASDSNNGGDIQRYDSLNANGGGVGFLAPILPPNDEVQEISFSGFATGNKYKLTCPNGDPTVELAYVTGENGLKVIQQGLEEACGGGAISASGNPPNTTVTFQGALGGSNQPPMTCTALSGAGSCSVSTATEGNTGPLLRGSASTATSGLALHPDSDGGGSDTDILYVLRDPSSGNTVVQQFGPSHAPGLTAAPTAVDDTHGKEAGFGFVQGVGLNSTNGKLYISATNEVGGLGAGHRVYVLGEGSSLSAPSINLIGISAETDRSATFSATVNPNGALLGCKFQYSTDEINWTDVNAPGCRSLAINGGFQSVTQEASGLIPNTKYFVRLQLSRPFFPTLTPVTSSVRSFTTDPAPPTVTGATAKAIDDSSVRVSATVDPAHSPTSYVIQYGLTPSLGSSSAPVSIGEGSSPAEVSSLISGLKPATTYYFKILATNLTGSTAGAGLKATTFLTTPSFGSCPNDLLRTGPSAKLPDCRAYEQASPTDKYGSDTHGTPYTVQASSSGDGITFFTAPAFPGGEGAQEKPVYLLRFADGAWSVHGLLPPPSLGDKANTEAWTGDLGLTFTKSFDSANSTLGGYNMVMRDSSDGSRTILVPQGAGSSDFVLDGTFDGGSKVVFTADGDVPVTSGRGPIGGANVYVYDRDTGELTLAGLLPDLACGNPPCRPATGSSVPPAYRVYFQEGHAVTSGGDIYFNAGATGKLYLRRDAASPSASTEFVSASQKTNGPGPGGVAGNSPQPGVFQGATPDGSTALFTSTEELTNDADTGPEPVLPPPPPSPALGRANIDGTGKDLNFIPGSAQWVTVDSGHVYWSNTEEGTIGRATISGASANPNFITGLDNPEGLKVDASHIYWAEARDREEGHGTIGRADLDGSGELVPGSINKEFITGAGDPHDVAVSPESASERFVYWTNGVNTDIGRATITGASPNQSFLVRAGFEEPWGIVVDATTLYWIDNEGPIYVIETDLDGDNERYENGIGEETREIAIDSSYIYWGDVVGNRVGRMKLDFTNFKPDFIPGIEGAYGVAVDASHIYWSANPPETVPPPSPGNDLYGYNASNDDLTDLAPGAEVVGVAGYSNSGSYVYFAANADLDGAGPAQPGNCTPDEAGIDVRHCSLYLWQADGAGSCASAGGCVAFVVRLEGTADGGYLNWAGRSNQMKVSRVSPDGRTLAFASQRKLTAYDNYGPHCEGTGPGNCTEFYRYEADSGQFTCLTCDPTGVAPNYEATIKNPDLNHCNKCTLASMNAQPFLSRNLSPDGKRFFFQSPNKLVPADVNGDASCVVEKAEIGAGPACLDVYEWEAPGKGTCTAQSSAYSPSNGGCIYLISTGTSAHPSYLGDVSESGDTAFILTRDQLVPSDGDVQEDIYAAKVDGGLAYQHAVRPASCEGDACRGASSQAPDAPGAGSAVFEGPGNPKVNTNSTRCPKGKREVRHKGKVRCVAKQRKHRRSKRHHARAANNDRGASR